VKPPRAILATLVVLCAPLLVTGASAERFANAAAGISLERPAGWETFATRQLPGGGSQRMEDEKLLEAIRSLDGAPLFTFAKHTEPFAELNPTIQINVRALGGFAKRPIEEVLSTVVIPLQRQHPDLELVGPVKKLKVSGLDALEAVTSYSIRADGHDIPVRSRLYVVPRGSLYFVIGMTDPPKGPDVAEREFGAALASIRIAP